MNGGALNTGAPPVNQADVFESCCRCRIEVFVHDSRDISGDKAVQV
jgi:hypothetical protein